ncbi:MAG: response regulator [Chitinophagales bacterium]
MINEPLQILLADDDENDRMLFQDALNEIKINTVLETVNNGQDLMNYILEHANILPQLLFLDLNMPRKNGLECLIELRKMYSREITIAIFSTSSNDKDIEETFLHGANIYMTKPNNFNELKEALNRVVTIAFTYQNTFFNRANFLLKV